MFQLSSDIKRAIYDSVMAQTNPLGRYEGSTYEDLNVVDFLKLIWDLPAMKSEDSRFRNAEADAYQHMVNNADWTLDDALLKRFSLLSGDQKYYIKFVEAIVSPEVRESREDIDYYVEIINNTILGVNCELAIQDFVDDLPCYRLMEGKHHESLPTDIRPNTIPIFVDEDPKTFPAFRLTQDTWDDYGYKTRYSLDYYSSLGEVQKVGQVRILKKDYSNTYGELPSGGTSFSKDYCSLGQNLEYYEKIKSILGTEYRFFLHSIRDVAIFSKICDEFCNDSGFKNSLLRYPPAEMAFQYAEYKLAGYLIDRPISFIFKAKLPYYPDDYLNIKFDIGNIQDELNLNRVIALIGNNGVGKTTVLSQLAECIVNGYEERFAPRRPIFKKVISASYSIFDKFFSVSGTSFNYTYCGIRKKEGGLMDSDEIASRRRESIKQVEYQRRSKKLYQYMKMLLPVDIVDEFFDDFYEFQEKKFSEYYLRFSSGQSMLINLIIEIVANIRQNTLILIDEPEVHLHPKGITTILRIINRICNEFASCCILATHSAVIVQELLSRNVIVMDRQVDGSPIVRPMRIESLGENLTTITEDVFGRNEVSPYYKTIVKRLVDEYRTMDEVLHVIQNNDVPISMPLYMLINKYVSEK